MGYGKTTMIYNKTSKVAIILPPKTGTRTIINIAQKDLYSDNIVWSDEQHLKYKDIPTDFREISKLYAFYRCPVDRFLSNYAYSVHIWALTAEVIPFCSSQINAIKNISIEDYLSLLEAQDFNGSATLLTLDLAAPQVAWLNVDGIELLNFKNFEEELTKISVELYGQPISEVPVFNTSTGSTYYSSLTADSINRIKNLYSQDYSFFSNNNITFDI
jgi:hypothetical protein